MYANIVHHKYSQDSHVKRYSQEYSAIPLINESSSHHNNLFVSTLFDANSNPSFKSKKVKLS